MRATGITGSFVLVLALSLITHPLRAQYSCGRNFEFQFLPMNVWGDDILREYVRGDQGLDLSVGFFTTFSEERSPLTITAGRGISFRSEFVSSVGKKCEWFVGARGWLFSGVASANDTLVQDPRESGVLGVRMWDVVHFPFRDDRSPTGTSTIQAFSGSRHFTWTADLFAVRRFGTSRKASASALFGLRLGNMDIERVQVVQNEAFIGNVATSEDSTTVYHRYWLFYRGVQSTADYDILLGPLFGFYGTIREGKFRIRSSFTQSFLVGNVGHSGQWIEFAGSWLVKEGEGDTLQAVHQFLPGFESSELSARERIFLPVTEVSFDLSFAPRKSLLVGAGVFVSAWFDAPVAARWSASSSDWKLVKATPVYAGLVTMVTVKF